MRDRLIVATTALALLAGPALGAGNTQVVAKQTISFSRCKQVIASMKADLGQAPIVIANTGDVVMVKWITTTDDMLLTCGRPDQRLLTPN